jgi:hypothetical protein
MFTALFWKSSSSAHKAEVETFITRLSTPVDFAKEEGAANANDARQSSVVGWLCLAYGAFVMLLALIPNPIEGRIAFVGCGGVVVIVGGLLVRSSRRVIAPAA